MRRTLVDVSRPKRNKGNSIIFHPTKSKDADDSMLKLGVFLDIFSLHSKIKKVINHDKTIYLPLFYVEFLHNFIIRLYSKSDGPVVSGYMSQDNLDYTMDHVRYIYSSIKSKRERIIKKAAFIMYNITSKHPFTDGNKRTAIITCNSFVNNRQSETGGIYLRCVA